MPNLCFFVLVASYKFCGKRKRCIINSGKRELLVTCAATMAWVVGMADEEDKDSNAVGAKKRKRKKSPKCKLFARKH